MNGIDGVLLATGQDTRAVEAAVHAFASKSGQYRPLTEYRIKRCDSDGRYYLHGHITIPLCVGVKGGAIQVGFPILMPLLL